MFRSGNAQNQHEKNNKNQHKSNQKSIMNNIIDSFSTI